MIICGYAGIGKSYLAHNFPNVMDLESTPFEKDWDRYLKCAKHYHEQGFLVLVSCHSEIRKRICDCDNKIAYDNRITIVPNIEDKEYYRLKYTYRGNNKKFIDIQMNNWEQWLNEKNNRILTEHWESLLPKENLNDAIIRLSKLPPYRFCNYDGCPVNDCSKMKGCVNPLKKYVDLWRI